MKLSALHESIGFGGLDGLQNNVGGASGLFKKQADVGRPEELGDKQEKPTDDKGAMPKQPRRSGNQNTPMTSRHRRYFKAPADGGSLESGSEQPEEEDGILNPGLTMKTERPVPNRAGRPPRS